MKTGYWVMLGTPALFARAAWRVGRDACAPARPDRGDRAGLEAGRGRRAAGARASPACKILEDEVLLAGTSLGMHLDRDAAYPARAHDIQGPS